jgi:hypothetical protein
MFTITAASLPVAATSSQALKILIDTRIWLQILAIAPLTKHIGWIEGGHLVIDGVCKDMIRDLYFSGMLVSAEGFEDLRTYLLSAPYWICGELESHILRKNQLSRGGGAVEDPVGRIGSWASCSSRIVSGSVRDERPQSSLISLYLLKHFPESAFVSIILTLPNHISDPSQTTRHSLLSSYTVQRGRQFHLRPLM